MEINNTNSSIKEEHALINATNLSCSEMRFFNVSCELPLAYALPLYGYCMPVLFVITIVANTLIVIVLSKRHMRSPTNVVLLAMALCDMFTVLFPAPWLLYMYTLGNHYKPLEPVSMCYAFNIMNEVLPNMFHTSSIWLTLGLAIQRYIYVCHPPLARKFCTIPNVNKGLMYIIITAMLHQSPRLFDVTFEETSILWNNEQHNVCRMSTAYWVTEYITEDIYFMTYYIFRVIFVHLVPCFTLVVLNALLFKALKEAQARRDQLLSNKTQKTDCKKIRDSNCTTLMLIVVVTVFLSVEFPLAVVTTLHILSSAVVEEFLDYYVANALVLSLNFLIILSYPINFGIYCGMSRQFRQTFKELFVYESPSMQNVGSSKYSFVNGPRTLTNTNETVL